MDPLQYVENSILQLEKLLDLPITIVDYEGWFNARQKVRIFSEFRKTHRKLPLCDMGFCSRCRENCRYKLNNLCMNEAHPHLTVCWKNLAQIALPLRHNNFHYGVLYAGLFRPQDGTPPPDLPEDFYRQYNDLPYCNEQKIAEYIPILDLFVRGLIGYLCEENILSFDYELRVRKLVEFMEQHYAETLSLQDASEILSLTPAYASSFIKQATGYNFSQLLRSIRIAHVRKMLFATDANLNTIAGKCGFANEFHLSKVFKQQTGESPSEYRKNQKNFSLHVK